MLQTRFNPPLDRGLRGGEILSINAGLDAARTLIARQYPLMILVVFVCLSLAAIYVLTAPKLYTATAGLVIDSRKVQTLQQQGSMGAGGPIDSAMVDSQVEILKSETIARAVVKDLRLADLPEFTGGSPGLLASVSNLLSFSPRAQRSEYERLRAALGYFQRQLAIRRVGLSYVIEISFQSESPNDAARIANAVAEAYIVDSLEAKYQASRRAAAWLQDRMKELREQASTAERAVADFRAKNNIVDAGGRLLTDQQLAEVNSAATIARTQRAEAEARLARISSILEVDDRTEPTVSSPLIESLATVTDTLSNPVIVKLRQQYLELAGRASDWSTRFGPTHLAVVNLRNQMREIRRSIADELRRIAETYKSDLAIAKAREEAAQKSLTDTIAISNDTSQAQIVLRDLESNAQSARALADNFLQLYMVSVQQQSFPITEARVITEASQPLGPSAPKKSLILAAALVGGAILAGLLGFLRNSLDRIFRTASQVESVLQTTCLATIPLIDKSGSAVKRAGNALFGLVGLKGRASAGTAPSKPPQGRVFRTVGERQLSVPVGIAGAVVNSPLSRFSEAIRSIKMAADLGGFDSTKKVLALTSSLPNEGKSTISEALARTSAQAGLRTLLVDGDLRNPSLSRTLTPSATEGLIEFVLGKKTLADLVWIDPDTKLHFLPCLVPSQFANSSDVLASAQMEKAFQLFRERYDRIFLDLSPLAPVVDVRATGRLADSYLLVIEWSRAKIDVVDRVLNETPLLRQRLLGAVLNKVDIAAISRHDTYQGDYYNNKYYQRYGYVE
ncbi:GNVR domain-containing protein [Bradyrhizobium sp. LHD-71]|uniref:GNVR domain-containing protein n=1 Tax=Bradyrhizobium sp. LHD-71 TaxID=3072141 RepID=UPI00280F721F|nr:GNVR domain-containing protein [Bradyrhizobium sp. LHD-71]MDQ8727640.1 GNVR domain-containing protein [Bradyrhizobium sp. LHD-71]